MPIFDNRTRKGRASPGPLVCLRLLSMAIAFLAAHASELPYVIDTFP